MKLEIDPGRHALTEEAKSRLEGAVTAALGSFADHIALVGIHLQHLEKARAGFEEQCRIEVSLLPSGRVCTEMKEASIERAVDIATVTIAREVKAALHRRRSAPFPSGTCVPVVRPGFGPSRIDLPPRT
ncbi:MAG: hypothetical protein JXQ73_30940 [Phycisphaerae bacterium]|nr:hypothetical protein [Phycisphaerae bacterium]